MKIAQIIPYDFSRPGGVKSHIENLAECLRNLGHEVKIIAPNINAESINDPEAFDILHFHNGWSPFLTYQIRYYSSSKNIGTFHDTPTDSFFGKYFVGKILMPLASGFITLVADELISVSKSQAKHVTTFYTKKPTIIPNGINPNQFNTSFEPIKEYKDGMFNLLYLGRFEKRKGLFYTLNAFNELKSKYGNLRLLIAGDGDQKQEALDYVKNNQLKDVIFLGFVDEKIKANLIRTADIMLATALFGESFGIVLLEAMACGTSMVGFGNQGYLNVIKGKWTEYFPKPKDGRTLTDKIEKLYLNEDIRNEMSVWGIEESKKYHWTKITAEVEKVYKKAMVKD
jgi:phosphatidylinositol alpha-mannosyltransferase